MQDARCKSRPERLLTIAEPFRVGKFGEVVAERAAEYLGAVLEALGLWQLNLAIERHFQR